MFRHIWRRHAAPALTLSTIATVIVGFLLPKWVDLAALYTASTFYFCATAVLIGFLLVIIRLLRSSRRELLELSAIGVFAASLSGALFVIVHPTYRVLADETNLISTSLSFYLNRTPHNITQIAWSPVDYSILEQGIATRPPLFPFLISIVHFALGYSARHAFVVNYGVSCGIFVVVVLLGRELRGLFHGVIAALFVAAFPLYAQTVTSAGFDAVNHLFVLSVLWRLLVLVRRPSPGELELVTVLVLFATECRYESVLLVIPLAIVSIFVAPAVFAGPITPRVLLLPPLFLPALWQKSILGVAGTEGSQPELVGRAVFSGANVVPNLKSALSFFFGLDSYPTARLIVLLGCVGAILAVCRVHRCRSNLTWALLAAISVAILGGTHLLFAMGDLRTPYNMRLGLLYVGPIALSAAYPFTLVRHPFGGALGVVCAVATCLVYLPVAVSNAFGGRLLLSQEYEQNLAILAKYPRKTTLVITDRPGMYVAQQLSAVGRRALVPASFAALSPHYEHVLAIQQVDRAAGRAEPELPAPDEWRMITQYEVGVREIRIMERQNGRTTRRVSRSAP
jgi:hypothetical protein